MNRRILVTLSIAALGLVSVFSCTNRKGSTDTPTPDYAGFPEEVGKILINKCAVSGCHNEASYKNASNLRLDSWAALFEGGGSGATVVPFSPDYSPLLYFTNTDPNRGTVTLPTMPFDPTGGTASHLSDAEYNTLKDWIVNGAPDKDGNIAFADNADTRQKIYLTQQGCDLVAVIDAESSQVMRYIHIGSNPSAIESPHCLHTTTDGRYAYASFLAGNTVPKIDTRTDEVVGSVDLGSGSWNIIYIAPGNNMLATTDWTANGRIVFSDAGTLQTIPELTGSGAGLFVYPHGIASNAAADTFFITAQYGNLIYRYAPGIPHYRKVSINGAAPVATSSSDNTSPNPHEILMTPDHSKYFLSCQSTNEVRVLDAHTDEILAVIPTGTFPQELALSLSKPYMFVTCMEDDNNPRPNCRGSVYVINYNTYEVVDVLYGDFAQPHAVTVDDRNGRVYVASTNANPDGPAPHHATACGGRAGWYSIYDLNTLQPYNNRRYQVAVMPYSADVRFHGL